MIFCPEMQIETFQPAFLCGTMKVKEDFIKKHFENRRK